MSADVWFGGALNCQLVDLPPCLPPSLIISFCGTGLGSRSPLFKQVSQTDSLLLMKAKLKESVKDSKISIHGTSKRGERVKQ